MRKPLPEPIDYSKWTLDQVIAELRTEKEYLDYYEQFDPNSIEKFIEVYAPKKLQMLQNRYGYKKGTDYFKGRFITGKTQRRNTC